MSNRAEQFLAFDALKGLREALKEKECIKVEKRVISTEEAEKIDQTLRKIKKNMLCEVVFFKDGEYIKVEGVITKIDRVYKKLNVVKKEIFFNDLISISIIEEKAI